MQHPLSEWSEQTIVPPIPSSELVGRGWVPAPPLIPPHASADETHLFMSRWYLGAVASARPHQFKHSAARLRSGLLKYRELVLRAADVLNEHNCAPSVFVYYAHRLREIILQSKRGGGSGSPILPPQTVFATSSLEHVSAARSYGATRCERHEQPVNEAHAELLRARQLCIYAQPRMTDNALRAFVARALSRERWVHLIELSRSLYASDLAQCEAALGRGEWIWSNVSTSQTGARKQWQR